MKGKWLFFLVAVVVSLALSACGTDVKNGTIRDYLANVEQTYNGKWRIWFENDSAAGYCTLNDEMGKRALYLLENHDGKVIAKYRTIRSGDPEFSNWQESGCGSIQRGGYNMEMFALDSLVTVRTQGLVPGE